MATSPDGHAWTCAGPIRCWSPRTCRAGRGFTPSRRPTSTGTVSVLIESLIEGGSEIWLGELQTAD